MKKRSVFTLAALLASISPLMSMESLHPVHERLQNVAETKHHLTAIFQSFLQNNIPNEIITPPYINEMLKSTNNQTLSGPEMFDLLSEIASLKEHEASLLREEIINFLQNNDLIGYSKYSNTTEPGESSQIEVEEKVDQIAHTQFDTPAERLPPEIMAAILVQLNEHELVTAAGISQEWRNVAVQIMNDNLHKSGIKIRENSSPEEIVKLYKLFFVSNFHGVLLDETRGGAMGFVVQVTASTDPNVPVGTRVYLHPDPYIWQNNPPQAGQTVFFNKVSRRPIHNPNNGPLLKVITGVKGYS